VRLEVSGLTIGFGGAPVVEGVSFAMEGGTRFGLVGESGSGKSLTALAIAGLLPEGAQQAGQIRLDGAPLPAGERAMARLRGKALGFVFQEPMSALNPLMRAGSQIVEAMALNKIAPSRDGLAELLEEVGLDFGHAQSYPHMLSGGQRQRVMIAMALASNPALLIADEPTSALDLVTQKRILELIGSICARRNMGLLFISHDLKAVAALCQSVLVLQAGKVQEQGPVAQVFAAPQSAYTQSLLAAAKPLPAQKPKAAPGAPLLRVDGVSRHFPQPGRGWFARNAVFRAVNDVSFCINRGETLAIVGPSGCGKTTLAKIIAGLDRPSIGEVGFMGEPKQRHKPRLDISLVFQDPFGSFDPRLPISASLAEPLIKTPGLTPLDKRERVNEMVAAVGLDPALTQRYPHEFSGGQRQRFAIARALMTHPKLVVLDEPVSALDMSVRNGVLGLLARLQDELGLTYLFISHDLDMVAALANRILVMNKGRIVEQGAPADLFAAPRHPLTQALAAARLPALP
jgi:peptide/nickel transport system ATP-binding protein